MTVELDYFSNGVRTALPRDGTLTQLNQQGKNAAPRSKSGKEPNEGGALGLKTYAFRVTIQKRAPVLKKKDTNLVPPVFPIFI